MHILYIDIDSLRPDHLGRFGIHTGGVDHSAEASHPRAFFKEIHFPGEWGDSNSGSVVPEAMEWLERHGGHLIQNLNLSTRNLP